MSTSTPPPEIPAKKIATDDLCHEILLGGILQAGDRYGMQRDVEGNYYVRTEASTSLSADRHRANITWEDMPELTSDGEPNPERIRCETAYNQFMNSFLTAPVLRSQGDKFARSAGGLDPTAENLDPETTVILQPASRAAVTFSKDAQGVIHCKSECSLSLGTMTDKKKPPVGDIIANFVLQEITPERDALPKERFVLESVETRGHIAEQALTDDNFDANDYKDEVVLHADLYKLKHLHTDLGVLYQLQQEIRGQINHYAEAIAAEMSKGKPDLKAVSQNKAELKLCAKVQDMVARNALAEVQQLRQEAAASAPNNTLSQSASQLFDQAEAYLRTNNPAQTAAIAPKRGA